MKQYYTIRNLAILFFLVLIVVFTSCKTERKENTNVYTVHSYPLPVNVESEDFVKKLRTQFNLSPISKKETRKSLKNVSSNSFFFVEVDSIINKASEQILETNASNVKSNTNFEMHKMEQEIFLLIYVTYEIATNISELDGVEAKDLTVFSSKNQEFDHLALIPLSRLVKAEKRKIYLTENAYMYIMDITIK